jgi:hypothetical protein
MPPDLEIYVISRRRNRETIDRFFHAYVDRAASESRRRGLMLLPLGAEGYPKGVGNWDYEASGSIDEDVERGLARPRRAFAIYLRPKDPSLVKATLAFTVDDQVVFGLAIDDAEDKPENIERAKILLHELAEALGGHLGRVIFEGPPPLFGDNEPFRVWDNWRVYSWPSEAKPEDL